MNLHQLEENSDHKQSNTFKDRLSFIREHSRIEIRNTKKQASLRALRTKLITLNAQDSQSPLQLSPEELTPEYLHNLLTCEPPNFSRINRILNADSRIVQQISRYSWETIFDKCVREISSTPRSSFSFQALVVLGNLTQFRNCSNPQLATFEVVSSVLKMILQDINLNEVGSIDTAIWALAGLIELHRDNKILLLLKNNARRLMQMSQTSQQFVELIASALNTKEWCPDEKMVIDIFGERFQSIQSEQILIPCVRMLANALLNQQSSFSLKSFALDRVWELITDNRYKKATKKEGMLVLSRLFRHGEAIIDECLKRGLIDNVIFIAKFEEHKLQVQALIALSVAVVFSSIEQLDIFYSKGIFGILTRALQYEDPRILLNMLKAIAKILFAARESGKKEYENELQAHRLVPMINKLQHHKNQSVYHMVQKIIDEFFGGLDS